MKDLNVTEKYLLNILIDQIILGSKNNSIDYARETRVNIESLMLLLQCTKPIELIKYLNPAEAANFGECLVKLNINGGL